MSPFWVLLGLAVSREASIHESFPVDLQARLGMSFLLHATYALLNLGWEFHFRVFLPFGLSESIGPEGAVLVQVMASSLLHIGQPFMESFSAIAAGVIQGYLALRTKSILSGLLQHRPGPCC